MDAPTDRQYSHSHEWFLIKGDTVTIGITQYAADALTDITYVELYSVGTQIDINGSVGEIESVKAASEISAAMPGKIIEINEKLIDHPELINDDAFGKGWLVKLKADSIDSENMISAEEYMKLELT